MVGIVEAKIATRAPALATIFAIHPPGAPGPARGAWLASWPATGLWAVGCGNFSQSGWTGQPGRPADRAQNN